MTRALERRLDALERAAPRPAAPIKTAFELTLDQQARIVSAFVDVLDLDGDYHACPQPPEDLPAQAFVLAWADLAAAWDSAPEDERSRTPLPWRTRPILGRPLSARARFQI